MQKALPRSLPSRKPLQSKTHKRAGCRNRGTQKGGHPLERTGTGAGGGRQVDY